MVAIYRAVLITMSRISSAVVPLYERVITAIVSVASIAEQVHRCFETTVHVRMWALLTIIRSSLGASRVQSRLIVDRYVSPTQRKFSRREKEHRWRYRAFRRWRDASAVATSLFKRCIIVEMVSYQEYRGWTMPLTTAGIQQVHSRYTADFA